MLAPVNTPLPAFTAVLFGLSGCLVDFGAQASKKLIDSEQGQATAGALPALQSLNTQGVPCAWLDELPESISLLLARSLPSLIVPAPRASTPWPAPHACWQALMALGVSQLEGSVVVSGEPKLLQSGLNAGLWTIGLASCGSLCGLSQAQWQALNNAEREYRRGQATLQLYALGVHSVIDHLGELESCLADIALRRSKGEKP
ncbi:HAD family phosphatase [Pseudomonas sp. DWP3-1-2]|jgi:beta-phosphoglucomutase-like phosphatase (HAD superfamily)|uniref:HAD family phosphatase n=1 Tax=Pseudomonas sp. DWP3-1-2 TaxID=2804645 RepID=UPI003CF376BB